MIHILLIFLAVCAVAARAGEALEPDLLAGTSCSDAWYRAIEQKVATGDGQGHGPDIGSGEWKSVVEFRLGLRGEPDLPGRDSDAWCGYIERAVSVSQVSSAGTGDSRLTAGEHGPSYDCRKAEAGSIEALVCADRELSALDRRLAGVYAAASRKAINEHPPVLRAEQRGWIKGRDDCWKSTDIRGCVRDAYRNRIAELQAGYRLVGYHGPVRFVCDGDPAGEVIATFFRTDPSTLIAEFGGSISLMYQQPSASGISYQGRNESFREHQGGAMITWGYGAQPMHCRKTPEIPAPE